MFARFLPRPSARRTLNVAACSAISNLLIFLPAFSPADPGDLDPTFGTGGLVTTDFAGDSEGALALVIQADSKVVVAGWSSTGPTIDFALARYNTDGSLDTSFGTGGLVTTDVAPDAYDQAFALAIQDDGKIIAAGFVDNGADDDFALIRYNTEMEAWTRASVKTGWCHRLFLRRRSGLRCRHPGRRQDSGSGHHQCFP